MRIVVRVNVLQSLDLAAVPVGQRRSVERFAEEEAEQRINRGAVGGINDFDYVSTLISPGLINQVKRSEIADAIEPRIFHQPGSFADGIGHKPPCGIRRPADSPE